MTTIGIFYGSDGGATFEKILLQTTVDRMASTTGGLSVSFAGAGDVDTEEYDRVLVSVGRRPNTDELGLDRLGLPLDNREFIEVDEQGRTALPHVFAIGDVTPGPMLAHRASRKARVAAEVMAGQASAFDNRAIPAVVYTDPELAWTGLTEQDAAAQGRQVCVGRFPLMSQVKGDEQGVAGKCMTCHKDKHPGLYRQWYGSEHAKHNVTCIDCHRAGAGDKDGFTHYGAQVATLVTPKDCGRCHAKEFAEVDRSYHATAGQILASADAYLAHAAAGEPVAIAGCENCHGSKVKIDPKSPNKLARESWPNSGIGRINPDGSKGSCTACHTRHHFDKGQARRPEACGKCHLGPDHPQKEVYEESKHGNVHRTHVEKMNLGADRWVVGVDYSAAPTCATCHMSASPKVKVTHDVGQRISWTLRPPVSKMKPDWQRKRANMKGVCVACHGARFADGHYHQFDGVVQLYNRKFAVPAGKIMDLIKKKKLLKRKAAFGNKVEWTYWELWHHEGRRARHGAAMMGPDYTWWHGLYEVAQHFYFKFLPEARKLEDAEVNAAIDKLLSDDPMHAWLSRPTEQIKADIRAGKLQQLYKDLYKPAEAAASGH